MADRENVIKAIDICIGHGKCNDCPYCLSGKGYTTLNCRDYMLRDALALLKQQDELLRKLQKDKDKLCLDVSEWKHKYHDKPLNKQEIIRCKNCKHGKKSSTFRYYPNLTWCNKYKCSHDDSWFCADGVAKNIDVLNK